MNANVTIIVQNEKDLLCVPNAALKYVPQGNTEKYREQGVWILRNRKPKRITVKTGLKDGDYTEVKSEELKEGMQVLIPEKIMKKRNNMPPRMF